MPDKRKIARHAKYIEAARRIYQRDGEVEIDDDAVVSYGSDPGAYVQAWVWVYRTDLKRPKGQSPAWST